ncbi:hypothetical protein AAVH_29271, partial [Aphelenchoides avenae]
TFATTAADQKDRSGSRHAFQKGSTGSTKEVNYHKEAKTQVHADKKELTRLFRDDPCKPKVKFAGNPLW